MCIRDRYGSADPFDVFHKEKIFKMSRDEENRWKMEISLPHALKEEMDPVSYTHLLAGLIGGRMRKSAMETVKMSFGQKGCLLFAILNVLQLAGWTAIMVYDLSLIHI